MSWTLGAVTGLHNPLNAEAKPQRDAGAFEIWRMANGSVRKHVVGGERWTWEPQFDVAGADYSTLLAAYLAANQAPAGVTFVGWETYDATEYSVVVHGWEADPYTAGGTTRYRVRFTIEERTA